MDVFSVIRRIVVRLNSSQQPEYDLKQLSAAVRVLDENPAYKQAVEDIIASLVGQWLGSKPDATDERERLYFQAHALSQVDAQFTAFLARNAMKDKQNDG